MVALKPGNGKLSVLNVPAGSVMTEAFPMASRIVVKFQIAGTVTDQVLSSALNTACGNALSVAFCAVARLTKDAAKLAERTVGFIAIMSETSPASLSKIEICTE